MRWGNVILGAVGLAVLEGIVARPGAAANVGGFEAKVGNAVRWFTSPTVPAFKDAAATTGSSRLTAESIAGGGSSAAVLASASPAGGGAGTPPALSYPGLSQIGGNTPSGATSTTIGAGQAGVV